jgi:hypothetical protein
MVAEEPPAPEPEPEVDYQQVAREQAQAALLPFTEDLAALADSDILEKVVDERPLTASVGRAARNERSMITSKVGTASAGISTANMSRNTGGSGLAGRNTTAIESPVASVGQSAGGARRTGSSGKASRSREEIELVFDKNKGAIFALYNRALRMDPTLEGKLVLRLTIAPSGEVTFCEIVSSELGDADLERATRTWSANSCSASSCSASKRETSRRLRPPSRSTFSRPDFPQSLPIPKVFAANAQSAYVFFWALLTGAD